MSTLQVRDFPDHMYEDLKRKALQDHRSIAQQTIHAVEQYLKMENDYRDTSEPLDASGRKVHDREERRQQRMKIFEVIESRPAHSVPDEFPSSVEIIREGRESR